jgi:autotransporter-associated beta strand protein
MFTTRSSRLPVFVSNLFVRVRGCAGLTAVLAAALCVQPVAAQTFTWNGGGSDDKWTTGANWAGGVPPSEAGSGWDDPILQFGGTTRLTPVRDLNGAAGGLNVEGITFLSGAGSFTLSETGTDQGLDMLGTRNSALSAVIANNSTSLQTIAMKLIIRPEFTSSLEFNTAAGNITATGLISEAYGVGRLTKTGSGVLTLSGANSYTGITTISAGTLKLGSETALGTAAGKTIIQNGATLDINGFKAGSSSSEPIEVSGSGVGGAGAITNSSGTFQSSAFNNITLLGDTTFGGVGRWDIVGAFNAGGYTLTKVGGTTVPIKGVSVNNPGDLVVSGGVFRFEVGTAWNPTTTKTATVASGARMDFWSSSGALNLNYVLNGGQLSLNATGRTLAGNITLNNNSTLGVGNEYGSPTAILSGKITGAGGFTLSGHNTADNGTGTLIFSNTGNDYAGDTTISTGILRLGAAGVLPEGTGKGNVVLNGGTAAAGTLDLNGFDETINGLSGSSNTVLGQVVNNAAGTTKTLTVGANGATSTYSGLLLNNTGTGGILALTKTGSGTLTLGGSSANTYTGLTTASNGTLHLNKTSGNAVGGNLTISGGKLTFGGNNQIADTATVTMSGSASVFNGNGLNSGGFSNIQETIGSLLVTGGIFNTSGGGGGTWNITNAGSFTGGAGNTIFLGNSGTILNFGSLSLTGMTATAGGNVGQVNSFTLYGNNGSVRSSITVGSGGLTLNGSKFNLRRGGSAGTLGSRLVLDGNLTTTGTTASSILEDVAGGTVGTVGVELSSTAGTANRTFNVGGGGANLTVSVPITNGAATAAGITKTGAGTLTLSGANAYSGGTIVSDGTLLVNNTTGSGTGTGGVTVNGGLLGGSGTIGGNVSINSLGAISAGNSPGKLSIGGNYDQTGTMLVEIAGPGLTAGTDYDWIAVTGAATLDGALQISLLPGFAPHNGATFDVLTAASITDNGLDLTWDPSRLAPAEFWKYGIVDRTGGGKILQLQVGVPEPSALVLLALGGIALLACAWRRR